MRRRNSTLLRAYQHNRSLPRTICVVRRLRLFMRGFRLYAASQVHICDLTFWKNILLPLCTASLMPGNASRNLLGAALRFSGQHSWDASGATGAGQGSGGSILPALGYVWRSITGFMEQLDMNM